ncbi:unnamed protein product [Rotaria sp. Silwood2]|nr:unnamed protein product [Rotaria sp. Silwood2]CAF4514338.1 unnamed protein product [Rotaria sp. Silwood2]
MQAQAIFRTKLSFRFLFKLKFFFKDQHSNDSLVHFKLKLVSKANSAPKVRVLSNIKALNINSIVVINKEEQRMKAEERRFNQQLRQCERAAYRDLKLSTSYLEDNEQESLNIIKQNVKKKRN